jgi:hypothetical protein
MSGQIIGNKITNAMVLRNPAPQSTWCYQVVTKSGLALAPAYTAAMTSLADLRKSYERAELSEDASNSDPLLQFEKWLQEAIAAQVPEPNAMTLATVASNLRPSTRVVLIKGYDERGIS